MTQRFESASKEVSNKQLMLRGTALAVVSLVITIALVYKSEGTFSDRVQVTALLTNVGDGLPTNSDVKFRGALVGVVDSVEPALDGGENLIKISLDPKYANAIPVSVTARVVPSNVFAVSSIQLIDNGPAAGLHAGSTIREDQSLATVQFQTALTKLRDIVAAASRPGPNNTVGILAAVSDATNRRGDELSEAGSGANRLVHEFNKLMASDGTNSTLGTLSEALQGLQTSAPALLDTVHHAIKPMRTIAEKKQELTNFLSAGLNTFGTMATAFENNTDRLIVITTQFSPVLGVMADGGGAFTSMVTSINNVTNKFFDNVWKEDTHRAKGKFIVVFTPNRMYTRADCPRYGTMEGPSCHTAPVNGSPPVLPQGLDPRKFPVPPELVGGNVGSVGSPEERAELQQIMGSDSNAASDLLLGPVARGSTVQVAPDPIGPEPAAPPGPPLAAEAPPSDSNQPAPGGTPR
ncbi:MAG: MCE family protein [Mycobacterium sp.]